jgi:hypothetical protein
MNNWRTAFDKERAWIIGRGIQYNDCGLITNEFREVSPFIFAYTLAW